MKHFLANENEDGRTHTSSDFDDRLFREYYSVPFRMGFEEGGSRAVMAAYNSWNGIPMMIHPVLKDVMIKEWGNDGLICTDGGALGLLITSHKRFPDKEQGSAAAVKAGINHFLDIYKPDLTKALKDGLLTEADMDAALKNLLTVYLKLGEMDPQGVDPYAKIGVETDGELPPWERESSKALARQATDESIVLLKNDGNTLPLDKAKLKTIAVIGPWIDQVLQDWYSGTWPYSVTILDGIREAAGKNVKVMFADGSDQEEAASLAKKADVAIVVVGNHPECNAGWDQCPTPSNGKEDVDRKTIVLEQEELVKKVFAANPKTIEVLRSSFPYAIVWSQQNVPAIVHMTHNSQEEGHGLADVLFGDYSPAGRLNQTWPTGDAQLLPILDYNLLDGRTYMYSKEKPLYPFGYGLSYTTFEYRGASSSASQMDPDGSVQVHVKVKNTGKRASDEVVADVCAAHGVGGDAAATGVEGIQTCAHRSGRGEGCDAGVEGARPGVLGCSRPCVARGERKGAHPCRRIERQVAGADCGGCHRDEGLQALNDSAKFSDQTDGYRRCAKMAFNSSGGMTSSWAKVQLVGLRSVRHRRKCAM